MKLILFDFDKTIISQDTGAAYMYFMLRRNPFRLLCCVFITPITLPFLLAKRTRFIGLSLYLWLTTVGMPVRKVIALREAIIADYLSKGATFVYQNAFKQCWRHADQSDNVVIVSGASAWMVKMVLAKQAFPNVEFVCSEETRFAGGMIIKSHCYAATKVRRIQAKFTLSSYNTIVGYSDSAADIPMLSLCSERVIVNPRPGCLKRFNRRFLQNMTVVQWK